MTDEKPTAVKVAEMLVQAHDLTVVSEFIVCDVADNGKEMTKEYLSLLRDYLPSLKECVCETIEALVGHTLMGVGE